MAIDLDGSTSKLSLGSAIVSGPPLTIHALINRDASAVNRTIFCASDAAGNHLIWLFVNGSGELVLWYFDGVTLSSAFRAGVSVGSWTSVIGIVSAANAQQVYIDGAAGTAGTTTINPPSVTRTGFGHRNLSVPDAFFDGRMAEIAVWNVALNTDERSALAKRCSPLLVRRSGLLYYAEGIRSPQRPFVGPSMTETALAVSTHPTVLYPN